MSVDPLPPDVQAMRKARINTDIIKLCSKPISVYLQPTAHGIGLYTHVAGPKTAKRNPHHYFADKDDGEVALLPLGGPGKIVPSKLREPPPKEVTAIYKVLQDAVKAEEKIWDDQRAAADARGDAVDEAYKMPLDTLKKKYGDVNTPIPESAHQDKRRHSEVSSTANTAASKERKDSFAQLSEFQRQSTTDVQKVTDTARRGSGSRAGNEYDVYRDPRRQRR
jgi:hypothetical protein